ncbi:RsmB/NOP family class I SAM-dependent RNA methyltransferase [Eilatimonas milleporae]|uniref:16S rRNA (Cytosine967-C5)-methyltransferase n=1 Tax=Eilatimonas milleporae TaxID=911205 RepID=A0A3M0CXE1_9PROT|nr:RsmB/NOP family class I SAM-dependent RNA methyltransferase [Eilatimonas milleporae]RMB08523.1 16S rRNA (cytosine967-C5)-methyltransferase [Eilatimonas milleporae]
MTPAARASAVITLLDAVETALAEDSLPADKIVSNFFRERRYAGAKDRRAVGGEVYSVIRSRALMSWALDEVGLERTGRSLFLARLAFKSGDIDVFGADHPHAPEALEDGEVDAFKAMKNLEWTDAPLAARLGIPDWASEGLIQRFGYDLSRALTALNTLASLDIRVNPLKRQATYGPGIQGFQAVPMSPIGFRAAEPVNIRTHDAYRSGEIEIQDEAAQVATYLVDAAQSQQVVDLCAGAGGKALLLSALMRNRGQIYAGDVSAIRLDALRLRSKRAGCRNVQIMELPESGKERDRKLMDLYGKCDRVILDVPCSGSGTWRRNPELRWRLNDERLRKMVEGQRRLLAEGAGLVRRGGRLIYMTCSVMPQENEDVVDAFLALNAAGRWRRIDFRNIWTKAGLRGAPPPSQAANNLDLQLIPHHHGTDGFYVCVLERGQ